MKLEASLVIQEVEERLKQQVQPLAPDLSLPPGLEKKMKGAQKGSGYGGSKEAQGHTKVMPPLVPHKLCQ